MRHSSGKLWKRSLGIVLTAIMVLTTMVPTAAFGVELNARAGGFAETIAGTVEVLAGSGMISEDGIILMQEGGDSTGTSDAANAAMEYLQQNYVNGRIVSNGGDGVTQNAETCEVTVARTIPSSGSKITSMRLKTENSKSSYMSGWYVKEDPNKLLTGSVKASKPGSLGFKRPSAAEGAQSMILTVKLFQQGTTTSAIDDDTAEFLASQDFIITLQPDAATYDVTFKPIDSQTKEIISGATIALEENWSTIQPTGGVYKGLSKDKTYTLKITADGYDDYRNDSFQPTQGGDVSIELTKSSYSTIRFNVKDSSGKTIDGAAVKVKQGYYDTISPQADGSYRLKDGVSYKYSVEAENYTPINNVYFTPSGDQTIDVTMTKNISNYNVTFLPVDSNDNELKDATIQVTYEDWDDWDEELKTITVDPEKGGSYKLNKSTTYTYKITADGYDPAEGTYKPSGDEQDITKKITMKSTKTVDPADQAKVDAIKKKFDDELGVLRPVYGTDKKITDAVLYKISKYTDLTTDGVTVELKKSGNTEYIKDDGTIVYKTGALDQWGNNAVTVTGNVFVFRAGNAEAVSEERGASIGWDQIYFKSQMQKEADSLTWDKIRGNNTTQEEVTSDLTLPQCMGTSAMQVWSKVTWTSSNSSVISIDTTGHEFIINPIKSTIHQPEEDTEVTLTATFQANDSVINEYVEKVGDFGTVTKTFTVTVKGKKADKPTQADLQALLDKYYTADQLQDFNTKETLDTANVTGDIQLPRYTRIKDENNDYVFANKEITVTTDKDDILKINGYRAAVDRFATQNEKEPVNLIVTFTRDDVTVSKKIPLTVSMITDKELDKELAMMDKAKEHYFDGINDGKYADKDSVTGDLHAFYEMTLDAEGNPIWIYNADDKTGTGIVTDDYQDGSLGQTGWPYNRFKSSNSAVVAHENLLVTRPEHSTQVTISSLLSSEKYGQFAKDHPDNVKLQKLYKQEVSVTVTVKGTSDAEKPAPKITEATTTIRVNKESGKPGQSYTVKATSDMAKAAGFTKPEAYEETVTFLDALVALHQKMYGEDFAKNPSSYLVLGGYDNISKIFGEDNSNLSYLINNKFPQDAAGNMTTCSNSAVKDDDILNIYFYGDTKNYSDVYMYFTQSKLSAKAGEEISLTLMGMGFDEQFNTITVPQKDCTVVLKDGDGNQVAEAVTDKDGIVKFTVPKAGSYSADVTKTPAAYFVSAHADIATEGQEIVDPSDPENPKQDDPKKDEPKKDDQQQDQNQDKDKTTIETVTGGNTGSGDGGTSADGSTSGSSAKTGDETQASVWMMLMLASMLAAVYTYAAAQKRNSRF